MPGHSDNLSISKKSPIRGRGLRAVAMVSLVVLLHGLAIVTVRDRLTNADVEHPPQATISIALLQPDTPPPAPPPAPPKPKPRPVSRPPPPSAAPEPSMPPVMAATAEPPPEPEAPEPAPPDAPPVPAPDAPPVPAPDAPPLLAPEAPRVAPPDSNTSQVERPIVPEDAAHTGRLVYRLTHSRFSGVTGRTVLDWKVDQQTGHYQIRLRAGALGIEVEMRSEGDVDASVGLVPRHYQQSKRTVDFDWPNHQAKMSDNAQPATLVEGTQDMLSFQFQVPLLAQAYPWRFNPGSVVVIPVVRPNALESYEFLVDGFENVRTGSGDMQALKLRRVKTPDHDGIEIWLAPQLQWLPVRLRIDDKRNDIWDNLLVDTPTAAEIEREERRLQNARPIEGGP